MDRDHGNKSGRRQSHSRGSDNNSHGLFTPNYSVATLPPSSSMDPSTMGDQRGSSFDSLHLDLEGLDLGGPPRHATASPEPSMRYTSSTFTSGFETTSSYSSRSRMPPMSTQQQLHSYAGPLSPPTRSAPLSIGSKRQGGRIEEDSFATHLRDQCGEANEILGSEAILRANASGITATPVGSWQDKAPSSPSSSAGPSRLRPTSHRATSPPPIVRAGGGGHVVPQQVLGGFASLGFDHPHASGKQREPSGSKTIPRTQGNDRPLRRNGTEESIVSASYPPESPASAFWQQMRPERMDAMKVFDIMSIEEMSRHVIDLGHPQDWEGARLVQEEDEVTRMMMGGPDDPASASTRARTSEWMAARSTQRKRKWILAPILPETEDLAAMRTIVVSDKASRSQTSDGSRTAVPTEQATTSTPSSGQAASKSSTSASRPPAAFSGQASFRLRFLRDAVCDRDIVLAPPEQLRALYDRPARKVRQASIGGPKTALAELQWNAGSRFKERTESFGRSDLHHIARNPSGVVLGGAPLRRTRSRPALKLHEDHDELLLDHLTKYGLTAEPKTQAGDLTLLGRLAAAGASTSNTLNRASHGSTTLSTAASVAGAADSRGTSNKSLAPSRRSEASGSKQGQSRRPLTDSVSQPVIDRDFRVPFPSPVYPAVCPQPADEVDSRLGDSALSTSKQQQPASIGRKARAWTTASSNPTSLRDTTMAGTVIKRDNTKRLGGWLKKKVSSMSGSQSSSASPLSASRTLASGMTAPGVQVQSPSAASSASSPPVSEGPASEEMHQQQTAAYGMARSAQQQQNQQSFGLPTQEIKWLLRSERPGPYVMGRRGSASDDNIVALAGSAARSSVMPSSMLRLGSRALRHSRSKEGHRPRGLTLADSASSVSEAPSSPSPRFHSNLRLAASSSGSDMPPYEGAVEEERRSRGRSRNKTYDSATTPIAERPASAFFAHSSALANDEEDEDLPDELRGLDEVMPSAMSMIIPLPLGKGLPTRRLLRIDYIPFASRNVQPLQRQESSMDKSSLSGTTTLGLELGAEPANSGPDVNANPATTSSTSSGPQRLLQRMGKAGHSSQYLHPTASATGMTADSVDPSSTPLLFGAGPARKHSTWAGSALGTSPQALARLMNRRASVVEAFRVTAAVLPVREARAESPQHSRGFSSHGGVFDVVGEQQEERKTSTTTTASTMGDSFSTVRPAAAAGVSTSASQGTLSSQEESRQPVHEPLDILPEPTGFPIVLAISSLASMTGQSCLEFIPEGWDRLGLGQGPVGVAPEEGDAVTQRSMFGVADLILAGCAAVMDL